MLKIILCCILAVAYVPALSAQASYAATRRLEIQAGFLGSAFTLDNGSGHEEGVGFYGDVDFAKHLGLEVIYRDASLETPRDIGENHLLVGPRVHFRRGRLMPYGKLLIGRGTINFQQGFNAVASSQTYLDVAIGGGFDFKVSRHLNLRLYDFEYQRWPNFPPNGLTPYGSSVGFAYKF